MSKVTYHPEDGRSLVFDVISKNPNGTVNIGLVDDPENPGKPLVVVGSCPVTETAVIGSCTEIAEEVAETGKKKTGKGDAE